MYQSILQHKKIIAGVALCISIAGIMSFQNTPFGPIDKLDSLTDLQDTVPAVPKNIDAGMDIKDFDLLLQNLDNQVLKMQKEVAQVDMDKVHRDITASLNHVNFDRIKFEIDYAMKEIDFDKIESGVQTALDQVDWDNVKIDVRQSLEAAKAAIEKINVNDIKKELEKATREIERSKKEIKNINLDELVSKANAGIARSKEELRLTKAMFNELEKDGLISQNQGFTIEYKNKTLFINGKPQSESVSSKYRQYITGENYKISIRKSSE